MPRKFVAALLALICAGSLASASDLAGVQRSKLAVLKILNEQGPNLYRVLVMDITTHETFELFVHEDEMVVIGPFLMLDASVKSTDI